MSKKTIIFLILLILVFYNGVVINASSAYVDINQVDYGNDFIYDIDGAIVADGDDPYLVTMPFEFEVNDISGIYIEFISSNEGILEIYWTDVETRFTAYESIDINYNEGVNSIYIPLSEFDIFKLYSNDFIRQLRIDPSIVNEDTFKLEKFQIVFDNDIYYDQIYSDIPTNDNLSDLNYYRYYNVELNTDGMYDINDNYASFDFTNVSIIVDDSSYLYIDYSFLSDVESFYCMLYVQTEYSGFLPEKYLGFYVDINQDALIIPIYAIKDILDLTGNDVKIIKGIRINFIVDNGSFIIDEAKLIDKTEVENDLLVDPYKYDTIFMSAIANYFEDSLFAFVIFPLFLISVTGYTIYVIKKKDSK